MGLNRAGGVVVGAVRTLRKDFSYTDLAATRSEVQILSVEGGTPTSGTFTLGVFDDFNVPSVPRNVSPSALQTLIDAVTPGAVVVGGTALPGGFITLTATGAYADTPQLASTISSNTLDAGTPTVLRSVPGSSGAAGIVFLPITRVPAGDVVLGTTVVPLVALDDGAATVTGLVWDSPDDSSLSPEVDLKIVFDSLGALGGNGRATQSSVGRLGIVSDGRLTLLLRVATPDLDGTTGSFAVLVDVVTPTTAPSI